MSGDPIPCGNCGDQLGHGGYGCPVAARTIEYSEDGARYLASKKINVPALRGLVDHDDLVALLTKYLGDEVFAKRFADCITMIRQKNADYTQGQGKRDRIAAFRRIGGDIDVSMAKVWAVFAQKHWGAVMKYVKDGQVESEPIHGRINDLINYFVLLGAIVDDQESK